MIRMKNLFLILLIIVGSQTNAQTKKIIPFFKVNYIGEIHNRPVSVIRIENKSGKIDTVKYSNTLKLAIGKDYTLLLTSEEQRNVLFIITHAKGGGSSTINDKDILSLDCAIAAPKKTKENKVLLKNNTNLIVTSVRYSTTKVFDPCYQIVGLLAAKNFDFKIFQYTNDVNHIFSDIAYVQVHLIDKKGNLITKEIEVDLSNHVFTAEIN